MTPTCSSKTFSISFSKFGFLALETREGFYYGVLPPQVDCGSSEEQVLPPVSRNSCPVSKVSHHMPELPAQKVTHEEVM